LFARLAAIPAAALPGADGNTNRRYAIFRRCLFPIRALTGANPIFPPCPASGHETTENRRILRELTEIIGKSRDELIGEAAALTSGLRPAPRNGLATPGTTSGI